jgi:hypothetical protein
VLTALFAVSASGTVQTAPDPDRVSPGFAGFVVVFLLAIATILLIRSMTKHIRKVPYLHLPSQELDQDLDQELDSAPGHRQRTGDVVDDQRIDSGGK